jgi:hypothetical protein
MESPDEVGSDEINELFSLTTRLEEYIANFSFAGDSVSGDVESGYIASRPTPAGEEE